MILESVTEVKLNSQDGISFELQTLVDELQSLINNGTRIFKLTGEKIKEIYDCAISVDGYAPKQARKFIEKLVCEPELISQRQLLRILPDEAKNTKFTPKSRKNKDEVDKCQPISGLNTSDNDRLEVTTSHQIIEAESEPCNDEGEKIKDENAIVFVKEEPKLVIDESYNYTAETLAEEGDQVMNALEIKVQEQENIIKQLNKKIKELELQLEEKRQNQIVRFSKDIEIQEDKFIPINGTCYCGGNADQHIILLDLKRFKELRNKA